MNIYNKVVKISIFAFATFLLLGNISNGQSIDEIKAKIESTTQSKLQLEKEIAEYQNQLKNISGEVDSLSKALKTIEATEKKNLLDIKLTENNIKTTELEIQRLGFEIVGKEKDINLNSKVIEQTLREINEIDQTSIVENLISSSNLSEFWMSAESLLRIQNSIRQKVSETKVIKTGLEGDKKEAEAKNKKLINLRSDLNDQKTILAISKKDKTNLLTQTKNKESDYKKLLASKQALADAFNKELAQFESDLRLAIDPKSIPKAGKGILAWPLDNVYITQKFGVTSDSGRLYTSGSHNGVDFRASVGTKVKAALSGTVEGTGDTDTVCSSASYGKWIFIRHDNGLSTLYGHLSLIKVKAGDRVYTGDIIAYSGNTGYSTGPHLHLSLYATQGVKISSMKSKVCKGTYTMPIADPKGYLDPLAYL
jgi:murein DD-endopeptidase MepM/ murein hydrolase activator NlpD